MPRKRSVSGRAKARTIQNAIQVQMNRLNKRQRSLKRGGNLGKYKSKELLNYVGQTSGIKLTKAKRSGRLRIVFDMVRQPYQQYMEIRKKFTEFLKSRALSNIGIEQIRERTREALKKTLGEEIGRKATDEDVDKFYEVATQINKASEASLLSRIDPSDFFKLVAEAKEEHWGEDRFARALGSLANIADINDISNLYLRREATELYHRYVA